MKRLFVILSFAIFINANAQVCFLPATNYTTGTAPSAVTSADFNEDGNADIVVANEALATVSVFLGLGDGSFGTATNFSVGTLPYAIRCADFNGDGHTDLAVTNFDSGNISVLLGTGTGGFGATNYYTVNTNPFSICSADFNEDGNLDLAVANYSSFQIMLGTGNGSFGSATTYTIGGTGGNSTIISKDFNGDGHFDIAVNGVGSHVAILLGTGTGTFGAPTSYPINTFNPSSIVSEDFNEDGYADIAAVSFDSNNLVVILGTGTGSFINYVIPTIFLEITTRSYSIIAADFNLDGHYDLALANVNSNNVTLLTGIGTGFFNSALTFPVAPEPSFSLTSNDFNGDGKADIAVANYASNNMSILLNTIPPWVLSAGLDQSVCPGTSVALSGSGGSSYLWNNGVVNGVLFTPIVTTTYTVTITDVVSGCKNTDQVEVIVGSVFQNEEICLVTVDTLTWKNKIMWEKTMGVGSESYMVYKETGLNNYTLIGNVLATQPAEYIDLSSVPESHGDKYKISVLDTCGNESEMSYFHKTMNLTIAAFGSTMGLNWDDYIDESGNYAPFRYYIYRGLNPTNMVLHDSVSGSFNSYNDVNVFNVYYYIIGVKKTPPCNVNGSENSYSNQKDNSTLLGINAQIYGTIKVSPNPFSEQTTIEIPNFQNSNSKSQITITDVAGKTVRTYSNLFTRHSELVSESPQNPQQITMNLSSSRNNVQFVIERGNLKPGVYFIELRGYKVYRGKLIVE